MASLFHPLCGANPDTLLRLFATQGGIAWQRLPQAAIATTVALARWPFSLSEQFFSQLPAPEDLAAPIFILGYWRSGTTHLHNLLGQSPAFGYISPLATGLPWDILGIVRTFEPLLAKALPHDRYVDNVAVTPESPQEDAIPLASMGAVSYYHGFYFPKHFREHFQRGVFFDDCKPAVIDQWQQYHLQLLSKVSLHQQGKPLLLKNPVYTAHLARLRTLWPQAKFIHIYRNPYRVFRSTHHFFTRLLPELALQTYDAEAFAHQIETLILESYPRMITALQTDRADLPTDRFIEICFEDLEQQPLLELEKIYQTLNLPNFEVARPQFEAYLTSLGNYRKNNYPDDTQLRALVETHWQPFIQQWRDRGS